jgi:hypothetical protein
MRRVEDGFGVSIPAAVKHVYSACLTVPGEVRSGIATHLRMLPKTLTFPVLRQVPAIVARRGIQKNDLVSTLGGKGDFCSRIGSPIKNRNFATKLTMLSGVWPLFLTENETDERSLPLRLEGTPGSTFGFVP